jgi:hypothetical protein
LRSPSGANVSASPRQVLNVELPAKPFGQPLRDETSNDVGLAPRRKRDNHAHRLRRIGLPPGDARDLQERGNARSLTQKLSAGNDHAWCFQFTRNFQSAKGWVLLRLV